MKRFITAYLTIVVILVFTLNLGLVILYGSKLNVFGCIDATNQTPTAFSCDVGTAESGVLSWPMFLTVNIAILAIAVLFFLAMKLVSRRQVADS